MTPRADDVEVLQAGKALYPRTTDIKTGTPMKTVKGAKESAADKPIFGKDAEYVDRAAQRRATQREETRLRTERIKESSGWDSPPRETRVMRDEIVSLDLDEVSRIKLDLSAKTETSQREEIICKSPATRRVCQILGLLPQSNEPGRTSKIECFLSGRMTYVFDPSGREKMRIINRNISSAHAVEDFKDPTDLLSLVKQAMRGTREKNNNLRSSTNLPVEKEEINDDIFPDAGDYVFDPTTVTNARPNKTAFERATSKPVSETSLPKSLEHLVTVGKRPVNLEESLDDYEECYPGVYESAHVLLDDEDLIAEDPKLTKRQVAAKERKKLDRQLTKVSKILEDKNKA